MGSAEAFIRGYWDCDDLVSLVRIVCRTDPVVAADAEVQFVLVRAAFGQRRKMLRRTLSERVDAVAFEAVGVAPDDRSVQLSIEDWGRLADAVGNTQ